MSKHTRGPWKVIGPDSMHPSQAMVCATIGVQIYSAPLTNETEANAHLIAAAPDLLEALKEALALMPGGTITRNEWEARARAALKKASGEE